MTQIILNHSLHFNMEPGFVKSKTKLDNKLSGCVEWEEEHKSLQLLLDLFSLTHAVLHLGLTLCGTQVTDTARPETAQRTRTNKKCFKSLFILQVLVYHLNIPFIP